MKASEPIAAYNTPYLQGLKNRLIASIDASKDEKALERCLELLHANDMPCVYTDEEFAEELRQWNCIRSGSGRNVCQMGTFIASIKPHFMSL